MKYILLFLLGSVSIFAQTASSVKWLTETEHEFGDIEHNIPVRFSFVFKNTGQEPLVIDNVRTSCGCTAPQWSAEPTPVDSTTAITIVFDSIKKGYFRKVIKVYFDDRRKAEKLYVEGFVLESGEKD